jgi:hypothetical protein
MEQLRQGWTRAKHRERAAFLVEVGVWEQSESTESGSQSDEETADETRLPEVPSRLPDA